MNLIILTYLTIMLSSQQLDWIAVFGYITITLIVMWGVFSTKPK